MSKIAIAANYFEMYFSIIIVAGPLYALTLSRPAAILDFLSDICIGQILPKEERTLLEVEYASEYSLWLHNGFRAISYASSFLELFYTQWDFHIQIVMIYTILFCHFIPCKETN